MTELTAAGKAALKWMREHGGDCAVARVKGGGRIYLAQGETAPFMPSTARQLIDAGLAEYVDMDSRKSVRFRLTTEVQPDHIEQKPCPFCGGDPIPDYSSIIGEDQYHFHCHNGDCPAWPNVSGATEAEAIAAWNTRPIEAKLRAERDALAEALERITGAVANMKVPQTSEEAGLQIHMTIGPALTYAQEALTNIKDETP